MELITCGELRRGPLRTDEWYLQVDLWGVSTDHFDTIVKNLKAPNTTALRLYNRPWGTNGESRPFRFRSSDPKTCVALERFFRVLARAIGAGGWVQQLELGFSPWNQDMKTFCDALGRSMSLRHLSLANSALGDEKFLVLAESLRECQPLQVLDLSGCALTDASCAPLMSIVKAAVRRMADAEWQSSLRKSGGSRRRANTQGLRALDLSFNALSDSTALELSNVLRLGSPLEALNLQGNRLRKGSAEGFLSAFNAWGVLRLVDMRNNLDGRRVGVLENGKHLHYFSGPHDPFWSSSPVGDPFPNKPLPQERKSSPKSSEIPRPDSETSTGGHMPPNSNDLHPRDQSLHKEKHLGSRALTPDPPVEHPPSRADAQICTALDGRMECPNKLERKGNDTVRPVSGGVSPPSTNTSGETPSTPLPPLRDPATPQISGAKDPKQGRRGRRPVHPTTGNDRPAPLQRRSSFGSGSIGRRPYSREKWMSGEEGRLENGKQGRHTRSAGHDRKKLAEMLPCKRTDHLVVDKGVRQNHDTRRNPSPLHREEWDAFIMDMAHTLTHIQEGLDVLMEPSNPGKNSAARVAASQLQMTSPTTLDPAQ